MERMTPADETELLMLRDFYGAWCELHSIPRTALHRKRMELAAQRLVDCGHTVARFKRAEADERPKLEIVQ